MALPNDPVILLSYVNTKLRDIYPNLDEFCKAEGVNRDELIQKLCAVGYEYNDSRNCFQ